VNRDFGWVQVARLGLVQACLGAIVVLMTSTLNRVMVVELALPALLPGLLVAWHYAVQMARPRLGHGGDGSARRTPWIAGGIAVLGLGALGAAGATTLMAQQRGLGIALAWVSFGLIGLGVSASGTSLLVLLAKRVPEARRAGAATLVWMMMIAGFAVTAGVAGHLLDPYSPQRLLAVTAGVVAVALGVTGLALYRLEGDTVDLPAQATAPKPAFRVALQQVWGEPEARRFTVFVFVSMLAYSMQDLILEPFAGAAFGYTPGESTQLSGVQHGGVLAGMILMALAGGRYAGRPAGSLRAWAVGGCLVSALALFGLALAGLAGPGWPLKATVALLGAANGAFSIAAIASMMRLAGEGRARREGVRMGLWGAAQAIAFALGGVLGAAASDLTRALIGSPGAAYALVFAVEGLLFIAAARLALRIGEARTAATFQPPDRVSPAWAPRGTT